MLVFCVGGGMWAQACCQGVVGICVAWHGRCLDAPVNSGMAFPGPLEWDGEHVWE